MTADKKPEVRKIEDSKIFTVFRYLGLRPKKIDPKYKKYVGLNHRMIAATIDTLIAMITIGFITGLILDQFSHSRPITFEEIEAIKASPKTETLELLRLLRESGKLTEFLFNTTVQMTVLLITSAICWKLWSATPGKMLMGMKIVDADTEKPITNRQIILRTLGYIPSFGIFFLGIFWISFNKRHQGWHDKIAGTVVIYPPKIKVEDAASSDVVVEKSIEAATSVS
jgi:hypothetical protein